MTLHVLICSPCPLFLSTVLITTLVRVLFRQEALPDVVSSNDAFKIKCQLDVPSPTLPERKLLVDIVEAWTKYNKGGVIVCSASSKLFLAVEFYGPGDDGTVKVEYVCATTRKAVSDFLRDEEIMLFDCSDEVARKLHQHIIKHSTSRGLVDVASGCKIYDGHLAPIAP